MNKEPIFNNEDPGAAIDLQGFLTAILKRKRIIIFFTLIVVAHVTTVSFLQKPAFTARGRLLIEEEPNVLTFEKILSVSLRLVYGCAEASV